MGRKSGVSYWKARRQFITTVRGERIVLLRNVDDDRPNGPNYANACLIFNAIDHVDSNPERYDTTLKGCLSRWLEWVKTNQSDGTYRVSRSHIDQITPAIGKLDVASLKPQNVEDAISGVKKWNCTTRGHVWDRVKRGFTWNVERGHIKVNPLQGVKPPERFRKKTRGPECYLPADLMALLVRQTAGRFRDFLIALRDTGARPGEIANAERLHYRPENPHLFFDADPPAGTYRWKNAGRKKSGEGFRRIFLTPAVVQVVEKNQRRGRWLFPHDEGQWTGTRIHKAFSVLAADRKVKEWMKNNPHPQRRLIPYSFRHTFITDRLTRGTQIKLIADLCGTSVVMIEKHYSHVLSKPDELYKTFLAGM